MVTFYAFEEKSWTALKLLRYDKIRSDREFGISKIDLFLEISGVSTFGLTSFVQSCGNFLKESL